MCGRQYLISPLSPTLTHAILKSRRLTRLSRTIIGYIQYVFINKSHRISGFNHTQHAPLIVATRKAQLTWRALVFIPPRPQSQITPIFCINYCARSRSSYRKIENFKWKKWKYLTLPMYTFSLPFKAFFYHIKMGIAFFFEIYISIWCWVCLMAGAPSRVCRSYFAYMAGHSGEFSVVRGRCFYALCT